MSGKNKTVWKAFGYQSCDDFAAYLNHMARKGWHFREYRAGLVFEQGTPEEAVYAVEVFSKAEETDTRPVPETEEFAEYCEAAGWKFLDAWSKFVVFKRIRPDAVPIMTDAERFDAISKTAGSRVWRSLILSVIWCVSQFLQFRSGFKYHIFRNSDLIIASVWVLLLLLAGAEAIRFLVWKRSCLQRLDRGLPLFFGHKNSERWGMRIYLVILVLQILAFACTGQMRIALIFLGMMAALLLLGFLLARVRPDSSVSALAVSLGSILIFLCALTSLTHVVQSENRKDPYPADPPVVYGDIWEDPGEPESSYSRHMESALGSWDTCRLEYEDAALSYEIFRSDHNWVLDGLWRDILKGRAVKQGTDCTDLWNAEIAILSTDGSCKVRYENAILDIRCDRNPLTEADISAIIEAFDLR